MSAAEAELVKFADNISIVATRITMGLMTGVSPNKIDIILADAVKAYNSTQLGRDWGHILSKRILDIATREVGELKR